MNGFLVVFMNGCDDVPVQLFASREDAEALANKLAEFYRRRKGQQVHVAVRRALKAMHRSRHTSCVGMAVATFRCGKLTEWEMIGDTDDE